MVRIPRNGHYPGQNYRNESATTEMDRSLSCDTKQTNALFVRGFYGYHTALGDHETVRVRWLSL